MGEQFAWGQNKNITHLPFAINQRGDSGMKLKQHSTAKGGTADTRAKSRQLCPKLRTVQAATPTNTEPTAQVTWTSTKILRVVRQNVVVVLGMSPMKLLIVVEIKSRTRPH